MRCPFWTTRQRHTSPCKLCWSPLAWQKLTSLATQSNRWRIIQTRALSVAKKVSYQVVDGKDPDKMSLGGTRCNNCTASLAHERQCTQARFQDPANWCRPCRRSRCNCDGIQGVGGFAPRVRNTVDCVTTIPTIDPLLCSMIGRSARHVSGSNPHCTGGEAGVTLCHACGDHACPFWPLTDTRPTYPPRQGKQFPPGDARSLAPQKRRVEIPMNIPHHSQRQMAIGPRPLCTPK